MAHFADLQSSCRVTRGRENRHALALEVKGAKFSVVPKKFDSRRAPRFPKVPTRTQLSSGAVFLNAALSFRRQAPRLQQRLHATLVSCSSGEEKGPVVVIDNYDSFTYNICQYLGALECDYVVYKNDEITVEEIRR
ncbi:Ankyrin Repeat [Cymbomonas tetramitiformis]|uniref:Ankyrin Repeat n=1 Tax=Cymbomonas tetramitiformis TaxID=36881 RepID=A0AAE0GGP8_9CHLO|nr:Ankyrin Repeat [Cymbomonas tetramitiformis]KAK3278758.1 Ankyrin Repeat [Cymbomonas tetramitiformis]